MRRHPRAIAIGVLLLLGFVFVCPANAFEATLLTPKQGAKVSGPKVEIAIGYNTGSPDQITRIDLLIDGALNSSKVLEPARDRGVASFIIDSRRLTNGKHKFEAKLYAGAKALGGVTGSLVSANAAADLQVPSVEFQNLKHGIVLSGASEIKLKVTGAGENPIVAVTVDKAVKGIRNQPPYIFSLNTKELTEGRHVLEAYAMDDEGNRIDAQPVEAIVRNQAIAKTPTVEVSVAERNTKPTSVKPVVKTSAKASTPVKTAVKPAATPKPVVTTAKTSLPTTKTASVAATPKHVASTHPVKPLATAPPEPKEVAVAVAPKTEPKSSTPPKPPKQVAVQPKAPARASDAPTKTVGAPALLATSSQSKPPKVALSQPSASPVDLAEPSKSSAPPVRVAYAPQNAEKVVRKTGRSTIINEPPTVPQASEPTSKGAAKPPVVAKVPTVSPKPSPATPAVKPEPRISPSDIISSSDPGQAPKRMMAVSLRWALEQAGLDVSFADEGRIVKGSDGKKNLEFQVGEKEVLVDDHVVVLPSPITSVRGRAMIPISFIVDNLGLALRNPELLKAKPE